MKYDHIIWDFNGTILDDLDTGIRSVNKLLSDRGLKQLESREEYYAVFGFPIIEYYRRLGFDFSKEPYEVIAPLWVEQYLINVKSAGVFSDVGEAFEFFSRKGVEQTLLSATELQMLRGQLDDLGLSHIFRQVLGRDDIHAASKEGIAIMWREAHPNVRVLMIGDTDHDMQVAGAIGADCVLISRGHQSAEYLSGLGVPVYPDLRSMLKDL